MNISESQQYVIKVMLDDITFMLFDLEMGNHIEYDKVYHIDEQFSFSYRRQLIREDIMQGYKNIISDFFVEAYKDGIQFLKFETRGELEKFTVFNIDGFLTSIFLDKLDVFRVVKFNK